jgi:hypothetical protein
LAISIALAIGYTPASIPSPTTRTSRAVILSLILCSSSFTPGRLNPTFKPLGCLNTGLSPGAAVFVGPVFVEPVVGFGLKNGFF